jgi:hypothetical protein
MNGTTHYVSPAMASWRSAEEADGHGSIASGAGGSYPNELWGQTAL